MEDRFSLRTTVRQPRVVLMWSTMAAVFLLFIVTSILRAHFGPIAPIFGQLPWYVIGPIIAAIQARPKIEVLDVDASAEGIRLGAKKMIPRAKLKSALLRREADKNFVTLRGRGMSASVDVQVESDEQADALCAVLGLDAKSTTAEFTMMRNTNAPRYWVAGAAAVAVAGAFIAVILHTKLALLGMLFAMLAIVGVGIPALILSQRAKILVGADGIVVQEGIRRKRFLSHDEIAGVSANGLEIFIRPKHGDTIVLNVGNKREKKKLQEEHMRQAQSIVWRIEKARDAYFALAGKAPDGALVLDRGSRTISEWIDQLRRIGEGANATFRNVNLTREQLLSIVESTSAAAKERLAAVVALHAGLTDQEKPRIRVAAERCVAPALREKMVRVADAKSDAELAQALEEAQELNADDDDAARRA